MNSYQGIWFYTCPSLFWDSHLRLTTDLRMALSLWSCRRSLWSAGLHSHGQLVSLISLRGFWLWSTRGRMRSMRACGLQKQSMSLDTLTNNFEPLLPQTENEGIIYTLYVCCSLNITIYITYLYLSFYLIFYSFNQGKSTKIFNNSFMFPKMFTMTEISTQC